MRHTVIANQWVWVALDGDRPLGFASLDGEWLDQLFVDPQAQGAGVGRALLQAVKDASPCGLWLHVFSRNSRARRFYEAAGFTLTEGEMAATTRSANLTDCTYRWQL